MKKKIITYKNGETRIRNIFLFCSRESLREKRWMEKAKILERYSNHYGCWEFEGFVDDDSLELIINSKGYQELICAKCKKSTSLNICSYSFYGTKSEIFKSCNDEDEWDLCDNSCFQDYEKVTTRKLTMNIFIRNVLYL